MKFGNYFKSLIVENWKPYYVDYKILKQKVKEEDTENFLKLIKSELIKVNLFVDKNFFQLDNIQLNKYIVLNYMAFFKSIKKYDKQLCKTYKLQFFNIIKHELFYKTYLKLPRVLTEIKLIVFDKDGTLLDTNKMFSPWVKKIIENVYEELCSNKEYLKDLNLDLFNKSKYLEDLYNILKFDKITNNFHPDGVIAKGTNVDFHNSLTQYLNNYGLSIKTSRNIVKKCWIEIEVSKENIFLHADIITLFKLLKKLNIKIAICTSDDRIPTLEFIKLTNISTYIDFVMCGDDPISSKPSPEPLWKICRKLDIQPCESMMIGDTISDIHAGINAKFGKVVGVLTGGYKKNDLDDADYVIDSIESLFGLFGKNNI